MKSYKFWLFVLMMCCWGTADAQLRYGFKTGLNFARIISEAETDAAGNNLEKWENVTGFHIGMTFHYKFVDNFGVRGEILYSKKGGKYTFDATGKDVAVRYFTQNNGSLLLTRADKYRYLVNISNGYIDIPVMTFFRWKDLEIGGGASLGLLIASSGEGSFVYSGRSATTNTATGDLEFNLQHNYLRDKVGEAAESAVKVPVQLNTQKVELPKTWGAYYDFPEGSGKMFNPIDLAVLADVKYYLSRSLYFGVRGQYGLSDVIKNESHFSRTQINDSNNGYKTRDQKDINFSISASVGFSF